MKRTILTLTTLLSCLAAQAQHNKVQLDLLDTLKISFSRSILPQQVDFHRSDELAWEIRKAEDNKLVASDKEGSLFDFKFQNPGGYKLHIEQIETGNQHDCGHVHPSVNKLIQVSPTFISFQLDQVQFSQPLIGDMDATDIILSIPVSINHFYLNTDSPAFSSRVIGQGVNCSLVGELLNPEALMNNGAQVLKYRLKGKAQKETYIMFDFIDHIGQVQTYYYPEKL